MLVVADGRRWPVQVVGLCSQHCFNRNFSCQALKRSLKPENSGRNEFERNWQKLKQIKWNAAARKEQTSAALKERDAKRVARWRQRAAWAAEAAAKRGA